ncbi:hypothetical protein [Paenibacillus sp. P46E]|uniref:hypothetical protein n=1 Tax=Paenibacillus sp. P46E TaxID=1349436 RepID=UPI000B1FC73C|nr:hypothetical protein [Paenibacillus sp. P46E]
MRMAGSMPQARAMGLSRRVSSRGIRRRGGLRYIAEREAVLILILFLLLIFVLLYFT